jgi:osmotically-inducible protein OsmY
MRIREEIKELLSSEERISSRGINLKVSDGIVFLDGNVPDKNAKYIAGQIIKGVKGVKDVHNAIVVSIPEQNDVPADDIIKESILKLVNEHFTGKAADLDIKVSGGEVTLKGCVSAHNEKSDMDELVSGIKGVRSVSNELSIAGASEEDPLDKDIAGRVENLFDKSYSLDAGKITVNAKQGIVTISGEVPARFQYDRAEETARSADGVVSVINELDITGDAGNNI